MLAKSEEGMSENTDPVYVTYFPDDFPSSPRTFYSSAKEAAKFATSPEGKLKGTRFKRFDSPLHANQFLSGNYCLPSPSRVDAVSGNGNPSSNTDSESSASSSASGSIAAEPTIPHSSVSRIQMTELKKLIEKDDIDGFNKLVNSNPRFLVNTSGDTPAIVMEGFRYNALHISAKAGSWRVTQRITQLINNLQFLVNLYGTTEADARHRMVNIVDSYLNTPDKGANNTPLHFAVMWGKINVVRVLVEQKALDKNVKNKDGLIAAECVCARYNESDKAQLKKDIELLLKGCYVSLYKEADHKSTPKCIISKHLPQDQLPSVSSFSIQSFLVSFEKCDKSPLGQFSFVLSAYAGPFPSDKQAEEFVRRWNAEGKAIKLSDIEKGFEKVGRQIAASEKVVWKELWPFLSKKQLLNLQSDDDLVLLDNYLRNRRFRNGHMEEGQGDNSARKRLDFDDEEDEDEFFDASGDISVLSESLSELSNRLASLSMDSPSCRHPSPPSQPVPVPESDDDFDLDDFRTPPSSPPPVFLLDDEPIKTDGDLYTALQLVDPQLLSKFANIQLFIKGIGKRMLKRLSPTCPALSKHCFRSAPFVLSRASTSKAAIALEEEPPVSLVPRTPIFVPSYAPLERFTSLFYQGFYLLTVERNYSRRSLLIGANEGLSHVSKLIVEKKWHQMSSLVNEEYIDFLKRYRDDADERLLASMEFKPDDIVYSYIHRVAIVGRKITKLNLKGNIGIYFTIVSYIRLNDSVPFQPGLNALTGKYRGQVVVANITYGRTLNPLGIWKITDVNFIL
ncbi:hypothetical protein WR25_14369 [Diploscapter pachys]|uniref:ANKLE2 third alpha/beta domain-containing protein n=1 Tax=Diploscapter pachys TaxID=2018661 RepID=A0A2A2J330_9BILA|nr:hypothetical protein WR25_14369 [Diploscapter pachys]